MLHLVAYLAWAPSFEQNFDFAFAHKPDHPRRQFLDIPFEPGRGFALAEALDVNLAVGKVNRPSPAERLFRVTRWAER